jgi:ABC-type Mn2+/Zn2+ transport system ATPase subunit
MPNEQRGTDMEAPLLQFQDVSLGYGARPVLAGVTFDLRPADFLGIVGPNGSGKTTLLRSLLGILEPTSGTIVRTKGSAGRIALGYVPQRDTIDPFLPFTVRDIVMMGRFARLGWFGRPGREDHERVMRELGHVGIQNLADTAFRDLSGGQKQRALIARALVSDPQILVLDEPTNGMDMSSRTSIMDLLRHLHTHDRLTIVLVSHLLSDVANYVNRIAFVDGTALRIGGVEEILRADRLSEMYRMPILVATVEGSTVIIPGRSNV